MAKELEVKYHLDSGEQLQAVLSDPAVTALLQTRWINIPMETTYYDMPSRCLSRRHWTLRHRLEGTRHVLCLKTPTDSPHARNEYEVQAVQPDMDALTQLCSIGAPAQLLKLADPAQLQPVCGASFQRQVATVALPDGSTAAISGDVGILYGACQQVSFCELELELTSGAPDAMLQFARRLAAIHGLHPEPESKYARARQLD